MIELPVAIAGVIYATRIVRHVPRHSSRQLCHPDIAIGNTGFIPSVIEHEYTDYTDYADAPRSRLYHRFVPVIDMLFI